MYMDSLTSLVLGVFVTLVIFVPLGSWKLVEIIKWIVEKFKR